jgi:hypothetical protein
MNFSLIKMVDWVVVLGIAFAIFLILCENGAHDCAPNKTCSRDLNNLPTKNDSTSKYIKKIRQMITQNYKYVIWRQALILGILVPLPIFYFLIHRFPTFIEWVIVGGMIFIAAYFSAMWMWSHYLYPNSTKLERSLIELEERLRENSNDKINNMNKNDSKNETTYRA